MKQGIKILICLFFCSAIVKAQISELWGLADVGGTNTSGIIFKINFDGTGYTLVDTLNGLKGGTAPGSLIRARNGTLYGMTLNGGANNFGIIFSYDVFTNTFTKIIDFNSSNGKQPFGSLFEASNGKLYGMTQAGGNYNMGVIFCIDPTDNSFTKLYNFTILSGTIPAGNLMEASNGLLYGMTSSGGTNGYGTIFSFDTSTNSFVKLHNFNGADGKSPLGSLVQPKNGQLYGMTYLGGAYTKGTIFTLDISTNNYSVIFNFNSTNGQNPIGNLLQADNGKLYGMTPNGGSSNSGIIFSIETTNNIVAKEYDFTGGAGPNGSLIEASDGNLYGMTENGGTQNKGTVFSFNTSNKFFLKLYDFTNSSYGFNPSGDLLEVKPVKIIAPNVFTPNGDNINDDFFVITSGVIELHCEIYNRWGQKVFTLKDTEETWNGKWETGAEVTQGTYFYIIDAKSYDGKSHNLKGNILLTR